MMIKKIVRNDFYLHATSIKEMYPAALFCYSIDYTYSKCYV